MLRRNLAAALPALALLLTCSLPGKVSEKFEQTVALSPGGSFAIENINGGIEIVAWERNEVKISAEKRAEDAETLREIEIEIEATGDRVEVETDLPNGRMRNKGASVSYQIMVPAGANVEAETVNGAIEIAGVQGRVEIETVNGAVKAGGLAGPVRVESVNGGIDIAYATLPTAGEHKFEAVNGAIEVRLPAYPSGQFHAETVNGAIETEFGLEVRKARFGPMRSLDGTLGTGGGKFDLETVNGAIRILNGGQAASRILLEEVRSSVRYAGSVAR